MYINSIIISNMSNSIGNSIIGMGDSNSSISNCIISAIICTGSIFSVLNYLLLKVKTNYKIGDNMVIKLL